MKEKTVGTLARASKGRIAPPPPLEGAMELVADTVASWSDVVATAHWDLYEPSRMDGIDFYVGEHELGHIHLDGSIHLATNPSLGKSLIAEGLAERFPYARGWVQQHIQRLDVATIIELFKRNYARFVPAKWDFS